MSIKFKFITPGTHEYEAERLLRWEVLRKPLGMPPGSEGLPEDETSLHLVAVDGKKVVGCVCFHPESPHQGRIFQMAVSEEYQGKGFGRKLIHHLEEVLFQKGVRDVYLFARKDVEAFYSQLGYLPEGEPVQRIGLTHQLMKKELKEIHGDKTGH